MKYFTILLFVFSLASCKYKVEYKELLEMKDRKEALERVLDEDLNEENQQSIKNYFGTLKDLAYKLKFDKKLNKYFNKKFEKYFDSRICEDSLLDNNQYDSLLKKCSLSGFYLCVEESKYYKDILLELKKLTEESDLKLILEDDNCKVILQELGV